MTRCPPARLPTHRRVFHGDASSRGRHRLWGLRDHSSPNDTNAPGSLETSATPATLATPNDTSNPSNPGNLSNRRDYSSEASSFIPSSILDLSRNEKFSLIVLRWLPSG